MSEKKKGKSVKLDKEEVIELSKDEGKALYGKKVLHLCGVLLGGIALSGLYYSLGSKLMFYGAIVATLDFLTADIINLYRLKKCLEDDEPKEDEKEDEIKLVK